MKSIYKRPVNQLFKACALDIEVLDVIGGESSCYASSFWNVIISLPPC